MKLKILAHIGTYVHTQFLVEWGHEVIDTPLCHRGGVALKEPLHTFGQVRSVQGELWGEYLSQHNHGNAESARTM